MRAQPQMVAVNLEKSARRGDLPGVQTALSRRVDPNKRSDYGGTALMVAAAGGHTDVIEVLLSKGADLELVDETGHSALMQAAARDAERVVQLLLGKGVDLNKKNTRGMRALDIAKSNGHTTVAALLEQAELSRGDTIAAATSTAATFEAATTVHVISTRFAGGSYGVASQVKTLLERVPGVACFNPNSDNAIIAGQDRDVANAVWLKKWREMLKRAQVTRGAVVQILSETEGLSPMQEAEADMAQDKDVRVQQISFTAAVSDDAIGGQLRATKLL